MTRSTQFTFMRLWEKRTESKMKFTYFCTAQTLEFQQKYVQLVLLFKKHLSIMFAIFMLDFDKPLLKIANVFRKWKIIWRFADVLPNDAKIP